MQTKKQKHAADGPNYKDYPKGHIFMRSGAKVGWRTYATKAEAEKCSEAARHNARIQESLGYDFGFMIPGAIKKNDSGYEVVIP